MKEIGIPLNFTATPVLYDSKQSFSASDESSGVLTFTTTANVTGTVASLTLRNASDNANRQTILVERLDINSSPFSYTVVKPLPFGNYEGEITLKKGTQIIASAVFLFGVNSSLSASVLPKLVEAYSLDALVEEVETEVSNLKDAYNLTVNETVKGVNQTESKLQASENVRYLNEATRKANELLRISQEASRVVAEGERVTEFGNLVDSAVIEQVVTQEVAEKYQEIEALNAPEMVSVRQQLADIENDYQQAVGALTVDSEVVLARDSWTKGASYPTLDARLESIEQQISDNAVIMGVYWNKTSIPVLTRTDASVGKVANVGISGAVVQNDFDNMPIYLEMGTVTDTYGNEFVKIPKFYIKKTDGIGFKTIKISKTKYPDYYLPAVFWDFENQVELPYYLHGKYKANLSADNLRLESKPAMFPLQSKNIVDFRNYAKANNNVGSALKGYQQLDIHAQDVLYCLFTIEFATLNSQSIMQGFSTGRWTATDLVTVASTAANTIIVANATADLYKVGQTVSLGTSLGGHQVFYGRQITAIAVYDGTNKAITVDGAVFNAAVGNMLYNTGAKSGFSADVNASSGTPIANDGKYPCVYRGIESPWGDMWQFVDGVNITDQQAWVSKNAEQYASNVFASPYEKVGYVNGNTNGYLKYKGFDKLYPFAELPKEVGGDSATYYSDYYYQATGKRIALVGGGWSDGSSGGLSYWGLNNSSASAGASFGGRLLKKAL